MSFLALTFVFVFSSHATILFHSDFERGETYLAKALKPGAKTIELVPNFRLEEWPKDGGEGIVEGNLPAQAETFRYTQRGGHRLEGVSGIKRSHGKWVAIQTGNLKEWDLLYRELGKTRNVPVATVQQGALFGNHSARVSCERDYEIKLSARLPFVPDRLHCRFYVSIANTEIFNEGYFKLPLAHIGYQVHTTPYVSLMGDARQNKAFVGHAIDLTQWRVLRRDVENRDAAEVLAGKQYCIEYSVEQGKGQTAFLKLWVNGILSEVLYVEVLQAGGEILRSFGAIGKFGSKPLKTEIRFDEIVYSDSAIGVLLGAPSVVLREGELCARAKDVTLAPSLHVAIHWQISSDNSWLTPEFNSGDQLLGPCAGRDVSACSHCIGVPFAIELGGGTDNVTTGTALARVPTGIAAEKAYWARARLQNNAGNWGEWSEPSYFKASKSADGGKTITPDLPFLKQVYFTETGEQTPLDQIQKGKWYDLHLRYGPKGGERLSDGGFLDLNFCGKPEECLVNFRNRGTAFSARDQYFLSYDFGTRKAFTRETHGKKVYTLLREEAGLYCDNTKGNTADDVSSGHVRFGFRLLDSARTGPWLIRGFLRDSRHSYSPMNQTLLTVADPLPKRESKPLLVGMLGLAGIVVLTGGMLLRRRKPNHPVPEEADPIEKGVLPGISMHHRERIEAAKEFIHKEFRNAIYPRDVAAAIGLSPNRLSTVFREGTGQSVGQYIYELRLDEAKRMLRETAESISEIGVKAGFGTFHSFRIAFRKSEGISPSKYRKKSQK